MMSEIYGDQVFRWAISHGSRNTTDFANDELTFGDGYEQIVGRGINTDVLEWNVAFDRRHWTEIRAIYDWLKERAGRVSFWFVPEDTGIPIRVRTRGPITRSVDSNSRESLSCVFREWRGA